MPSSSLYDPDIWNDYEIDKARERAEDAALYAHEAARSTRYPHQDEAAYLNPTQIVPNGTHERTVMEIDELEQPEEFAVTVNGSKVVLATATLEALRAALRAKGIVTFAAVVNGDECSNPASLVEAIANGEQVEIRTYAKPGAHRS